MQSLLRTITEHGTAPDGEEYLVSLLHNLHDTEWAGQEDKRAFVAELLQGGTRVEDEKNHPLYHVLEAVETVCTWWP